MSFNRISAREIWSAEGGFPTPNTPARNRAVVQISVPVGIRPPRNGVGLDRDERAVPRSEHSQSDNLALQPFLIALVLCDQFLAVTILAKRLRENGDLLEAVELGLILGNQCQALFIKAHVFGPRPVFVLRIFHTEIGNC